MKVDELHAILGNFSKRKILVLGDIMLDHYLRGSVERISPEAPVPVVDVIHEENRLGGASNVADNLLSLGAQVKIVGLIGNDMAGETIRQMLLKKGMDISGLVITDTRPTTQKTRIIAHQQQMVRIDHENKTDIGPDLEDRIIDIMRSSIADADALILEDYNKGLLTPRLIQAVIEMANAHHKIITVDPKFKNFFAYTNCTVFKPNFSELQKNLGVLIETEEQFQSAVSSLAERIHATYLVITRGEKGLCVFSKGQPMISIPTYAREIFDVSGAGDTVISTLTLSLAAGSDIRGAATIANHAAGVVCGKMGTSVVNQAEILQSVQHYEV